MSNPNDGLDSLRERAERRKRSVPPPRHGRTPAGEDAQQRAAQPAEPVLEDKPRDEVGQPVATELPQGEAKAERQETLVSQRKAPRPGDRPNTQPDEPLANLAIRVRHSLDDRLGDVVHSLKREGIRTSKSEVVEMLLWELPATPAEEFKKRLAVFRRQAPRERPL